MRAPLILAFALIVGGIYYLEYSAEAGAKAFCDAAPVGASIAKVAEGANGTGTRMLRQIGPNSVTVGFTGLPPYSRYFCTVDAEGGKVIRARQYTLD